MTKVLVTGATGFVGSALVKELLKRNFSVRVIIRHSSNLHNIKDLGVERVTADILDKKSMLKAMEGIQQLYHVAGIYRTWLREYKRLHQVNVEGTKIVLEAALQSGVKKVVHTSSIAALGIKNNGLLSDEETPFNMHHLKLPYEISKYESEKVAYSFFRRGLPVVIVRPALVMGDGDLYPTPSGKIVLDILKNKILAYFDGGIDIVDVHDVAIGHLLAMEKGKPGESYNLGNKDNFVFLKDLFILIGKIGGVTAPRLKVPVFLALAWAHILTFIADKLTHQEPLITPESIHSLAIKRRVNFSKAIRALGIPQTPLNYTIKSTINWYRKEGYL